MKNDEMTAAQFRKLKTVKRPKYGAIRTVVNGITFDSKREAEYYRKLLILKNAGEIADIELQPKFPYKIIYTLQHPNSPIVEKKEEYRGDFRVTFADGTVEVIDTKGFATAVFKRKKEVVEKLYGITIKIVN